MSFGLALVLFLGAAPAEQPAAKPVAAKATPESYTSYTEAYRAAKQAKRPMLVILNPPKAPQVTLVSLEDVKKTEARRNLLQDYVVAVIDTGTPHGKKVHEIFGSPQLPRVTVIDKDQAMQVYQTSEALYGQMWDQILEVFHNADQNARMPAPSYCPSCQLYNR